MSYMDAENIDIEMPVNVTSVIRLVREVAKEVNRLTPGASLIQGATVEESL